MKNKILAFLKSSTAPQNILLKTVYVIGRRLYKWYGKARRFRVSDVFWSLDQTWRKFRMSLISKKTLEGITQRLSKGSRALAESCLISITFGSRQFGNRDNLLEKLLIKSFLSMTEHPEKIEMLIKIDTDDDLLFFDRIHRQYRGRINLRFFVSERGRGYRDIHKWHSSLFKFRSPNSRFLIIFSEDAEFCYKNWDTALLSQIDPIPHNFFVGTLVPLEETIKIHGPNPVSPPLYWIGGADFPVIGTDIPKYSEQITRKYRDWTPLGNTFSVEAFAADLVRRAWQLHHLNIHLQTPMFAKRRGVFCWTANEDRKNARTESLMKFFEKETQKVRDEIAGLIYETVAKKATAPDTLKIEEVQKRA